MSTEALWLLRPPQQTGTAGHCVPADERTAKTLSRQPPVRGKFKLNERFGSLCGKGREAGSD